MSYLINNFIMIICDFQIDILKITVLRDKHYVLAQF